MNKGVIPPQYVEAEEIVLGQLLISEDAILDVEGLLVPQSFYKQSHQLIFSSIKDLYKSNQPINLLTVTQNIMSKGKLDEIGGPVYLSQLSSKVSSSANIEAHARIIAEKKIRREIIQSCSDLIKSSYDESIDINDTLSRFQSESLNIGSELDFSKSITLHDALESKLKKLTDNTAPKSFIKSKFTKINELFNGWGNGCLIGIGGRPSHGKSIWMLNDAKYQAENGIPSLIFSMEMNEEEIAVRSACIGNDLDSRKISKGEISAEEWKVLDKELSSTKELPLYIENTPKLSIYQCEKRIKKMYKEKGVRIVYIDYLQLMDGDPKMISNRNYYIGSVSRRLKQLAQELDIPIIILGQLKRDVDARALADRIGKMSDFKDSGDIEQDLDVAAFIMMPWRYGVESMELPSKTGGTESVEVKYKAIFNVDKARGGTTGLIVLDNSKTRMTWTDENEHEEDLPF